MQIHGRRVERGVESEERADVDGGVEMIGALRRLRAVWERITGAGDAAWGR